MAHLGLGLGFQLEVALVVLNFEVKTENLGPLSRNPK